MTTKSPLKISVITATWNCASTVEGCLASVAEQTWLHREHVVIDGASTDGTVELLHARRDQLAVLRSEADQGIYDALNKGLGLASGDIVGFLHADDLFSSPTVLEQVAVAFEDASVSAVYGDLQYVRHDDIGHVVRDWRSSPVTPKRLSNGWMPPHPTLYVRRDWYRQIGGFDSSYRIAADYLSILRLFSQPGFKAHYLPEVLVTMRLGGASNRSLRAITRKTQEDWRALRQVGVGPFGSFRALLFKNLSKLRQFRHLG